MESSLERNIKIVEMRIFKRLSYRELAKIFTLTPERIRQIIYKYHQRAKVLLKKREEIIKARYGITLKNDKREITPDDFCLRTRRALLNGHIKTFYDLSQKTESDLMKLKNFGKKSLKEVRIVLGSMGLRLKQFENVER